MAKARGEKKKTQDTFTFDFGPILGPKLRLLQRMGHGKLSAFVKAAVAEKWEREGKQIAEDLLREAESMKKIREEMQEALK